MAARSGSWALLALAVMAVMAWQAAGHAQLNWPRSRNFIARERGIHYCPHCGQGGGRGKMPSMCGDPFQDSPGFNYTDRFFGVNTTLVEGSVITTEVLVTTNHGGRFAFRVCPLPRSQATQECFDRPEHQLRRADNNKLYAYLRAGDTLVRGQWRMPAGISCDTEEGCMFQWWWLGYQFCYIDCEADDVAGECGQNMAFPVGRCVPQSPLQTEIFYNCADVRILKAGSTAPGIPPVTTLPPSPASTLPPYTEPSPFPSARPPSPSPSPSPSPRPPTPPSPPSSNTCPVTRWPCSTCNSLTAATPTLTLPCYDCVNAVPSAPFNCHECLSATAGIAQTDSIRTGCLACTSRGLPAWSCIQNCARPAGTDATALSECTTCLAAPGMASSGWSCANCLAVSKGDAEVRRSCLSCVQQGLNGYACGKCAEKPTVAARQQCVACLAGLPAGADSWVCWGAA